MQTFYHPKFLPTWILIGFMKLGAKLPFKIQLLLGKSIGKLLHPLLKEWRTTAMVNISQCFPSKNQTQVKQLVKQHFEAIGIALFETANAFFASDAKVKSLINTNNAHHLQDAIKQNKRIILLSAHFMPLMLGGRALLLQHKIANIYRPQNNPLFDKIMHHAYQSKGASMIKTKDTRSMMKALKSGTPIWYAPDQDLGEKHSVFAPFFNIQTATITATARLAKTPNTVVIPYFFTRNSQGYSMDFSSPLANYPSEDAVQDATQTNQLLEAQILTTPEQYLWIHKRFKTRPKGENSFY